MATETKKKNSAVKTVETIPETMRAAAIDRFGGPDVLSLHKLKVPKLDHGEVLIEIDTAGVGIWDAEMRAGEIPIEGAAFPLVLGTDGAGRVAALGSHIRRFKVGDAVYAYSFANPKGGFYAEYVAVDADKVALIPKRLGLKEAGAIPTTGLTALQGIDDALKIRRDETVIVHGGSGGVGTLAIQFAKLRGARVLATASGDDGQTLVRRLGADASVDARRGDILAAAREFAPDGIDAVLGLVGGEELRAVPRRAASRCDALRGRTASNPFPPGGPASACSLMTRLPACASSTRSTLPWRRRASRFRSPRLILCPKRPRPMNASSRVTWGARSYFE